MDAGQRSLEAEPSGRSLGRRRVGLTPLRSPSSRFTRLCALAASAVVFVVVLNAFVGQVFVVPSGSMQRTLAVGDRILVSKLSYRLHPIHRGDVVVFNAVGSLLPSSQAPTGPMAFARRALAALGLPVGDQDDFVKRVVGVGGDDVRCCDDAGRLTVNGTPLAEPYRYPGDAASARSFHIRVPAGKLWVMGDHRSDSDDSRAHLGDPGGGFVPVEKVIGRAAFVVWPLGRLASLAPPGTSSHPRALSSPGPRVGVSSGTTGGAVAVGAMTPFACPRRKIRRGSSRRG